MNRAKLMRHIAFAAIAILLALTSGCATYYSEASSSEPHAVLKFEVGDGLAKVLGGQKILPLEINSQPPNEWTKLTLRSFKVHPGPIRLFLLVSGSLRVQATVHLGFNVIAGKTYYVTETDKDEYYLVEVKDEAGTVVTSGEARKEAAQGGGGTYVPIFIPTK